MRMGTCAALLVVFGFMSVCLFDILVHMSQEHKRLADEEAKGLQLDVQLKAKR